MHIELKCGSVIKLQSSPVLFSKVPYRLNTWAYFFTFGIFFTGGTIVFDIRTGETNQITKISSFFKETRNPTGFSQR